MGLALYLALLVLAAPAPTPLERARAAFPTWTVSDSGRGFLVATPGARGHAAVVDVVVGAARACELELVRAPLADAWVAFALPDRASFLGFVAARYPAEVRADLVGPGTHGFADAERRWIVVDHGAGPGTLAHEVVHPLVRQDFAASGRPAPMWLDEGIAALFEHKRYAADGRVIGLANWRMPTLRARLDRISVREVVSADGLAFQGRGDLMMAAARHLVLWLHERGWLSSLYRGLRDDPAGAASVEAHVARVTGMDLDALDAAWKRWVRGAAR
ncbi:MAG: hypothetical protein IT385_25140 [Deltaproteobacteria bacterium]|nr:hypothetical protein [Deltaproteobacteria bacterium]